MFRRRGDLLVELCEFHKAWPQDARYANGWSAAYFSRSLGAPLSVGLLRCYP
jgi:hypothetical protein